MAQASDPCTCPQGHDDTVKLLSSVSVGGRAPAAGAAPGPSGGGCCGGACGLRRLSRPHRPPGRRLTPPTAATGQRPHRDLTRPAGGPTILLTIGTERLYGEITGSTATLADLASGADLTRQVPTCPDWTMRQLITHVGRAHRWATAIVATRAAQTIPFREVPDGKLPGDQREHADWLRGGAARLVEAVEAARAMRQVWTHLGPGPARYWARRMAPRDGRPPRARRADRRGPAASGSTR